MVFSWSEDLLWKKLKVNPEVINFLKDREREEQMKGHEMVEED